MAFKPLNRSEFAHAAGEAPQAIHARQCNLMPIHKMAKGSTPKPFMGGLNPRSNIDGRQQALRQPRCTLAERR